MLQASAGNAWELRVGTVYAWKFVREEVGCLDGQLAMFQRMYARNVVERSIGVLLCVGRALRKQAAMLVSQEWITRHGRADFVLMGMATSEPTRLIILGLGAVDTFMSTFGLWSYISEDVC